MGGADRIAADTRPVHVGTTQKIEMYLVLEGEQNGLPVYCSEFSTFRIDGRAIPARLVLDPVRAGLRGAEIHWVSLQPLAGGRPWNRTMLPRGDGRWSLDVLGFDGPSAPGIVSTTGTCRYAAAVLLPGRPRSELLETDGWSMRPGWNDPEQAPGFLVSRHRGESISGYARGFARLPVHEGASLAHARHRVALRPIDFILTPYEEFAKIRLEGPREEPLDAAVWSWLFDVILERGLRRDDPDARAVGARGRGVRWRSHAAGPKALLRNDILLVDDHATILLNDDGDGWLGNRDIVLHASGGEIAQAELGTIPGKTFRLVRLRSFADLRRDLGEAGYGELGQSFLYTVDLRRAIREFERDHGLPVDGVPDPELFAELEAFLERLRAPDASGAAPAGP